MSLNIKNAQVEHLAGAVARATGTNKTQAILQALREKIDSLRMKKSAKRIQEDLLEIARRCARLPDKDKRSAKEILDELSPF